MLRLFFLIILFSLSVNVFAKQSGGGGTDEGLEGVCQLSGGTWHGSESSGSWACCWDNWGCYGCTNNVCKMVCRTQRCRKANGMSRVRKGETRIKNLAPEGNKAPVIPMMKKTHHSR